MRQKRWLMNSLTDGTAVEEFRSKLKVDRVIAQLLLQRGIDSFEKAEKFFRPSLDDLYDPFLMKDMEEAVERLQEAIEENQRVMLFGDYDVDGTTAVAVMYSFLKNTLPIEYYIPDRYAEGYGLSKQGVDVAIANDVKLLITLDCGVKGNDLIQYASDHGIDVIVCDHHTPAENLPNCIVLDPKRKDCSYPFKELSGCGVGFKLLQGLCDHNNWNYDQLFELLDFVALSIGADIVPIVDENRIMCFHGMKQLNNNPRTAFRELIALANKSFPLTLTDVVFTIAPRINAVGRLRSGRFAVEFMISDNVDEIKSLAFEINRDNADRKEIDKSITSEALEMMDESGSYTTVVYNDDWHKGVIGIVASRLIEHYYKPTIVLTESNGLITGSARSIKGFDIHDALNECSDLLEQFGGHKYAAGLTLKKENLEAFKVTFEKIVKEKIDDSILVEEQAIDLEIGFDQVYTVEENRMKIPRLKRILKQFEPHGPGNMKPVFVSKNVFTTDIRLLKDAHLKMAVTQPSHDVVINAIGFNMPEKQDEVSSGLPFDLVYTIEENHWNGSSTIQLNIKDIRGE